MLKFSPKLYSWERTYANDNDAYVPEKWALESLMILKENMVAGNLVHRDFQDEIQDYGDVVNTRQPGTFTAVRKTDTDDVTNQDATATNVAVPLDQHLHISFMLKDGEMSKSFKDLVTEHLEPAIVGMAQAMDQIVIGQSYQFLGNVVGKLETTTLTRQSVIDVREKMNDNNVPFQGRNLLVSSAVEGQLLNIADFVNAEKVGDDGTALREGSLGRKFGIDIYMDQFVPSIAIGNSITSGAINGGNLIVGSTTLTVDGFTGSLTAGSWCTIVGDMIPQFITSISDDTSGNTTAIVVSPGLATAVVDDAVVTVYDPGAVNLLAGYAAAYGKAIIVDGFTVSARQGQLITFGTATNKYQAINSLDADSAAVPSTTGLVLDRPLDAGIVNDAVVGIGPQGEYCFGFHRNALSLVNRPLALPESGGVLASVINDGTTAMRVVIDYDSKSQGHRVTVDTLCGVKVLNTSLGVVMLG